MDARSREDEISERTEMSELGRIGKQSRASIWYMLFA